MEYSVKNIKKYKKDLYNMGASLIFDKVNCFISFDRKYKRVDIKISKKEKVNRKNIDLYEILKSVIEFINTNNEFIESDEFVKEDILKCSNVKYIELTNLKIVDKDIKTINENFKNLRMYKSKNCTYYRNCNLGILKSDIIDIKSDIYDFGMFNGYNGDYLSLTKSRVKRMNETHIHLNNQVLVLRDVNINYEKFFLMTSANKLRKLCIYRKPNQKLTSKDLMFVSGFYNLESADIDGVITDYKEIKKLEKLRKIDRLYIKANSDLEIVKEKYYKIYNELVEKNYSQEIIYNFLAMNRVQIQNKYQEFLHKLYVDRLERIKYQDKININDLKQIKKELLEIDKLNSFEKNLLGRAEEKELDFFDSINELDFDYRQKKEEVLLVESRPFSSDGIQYYKKQKHLILDKWGSTYGKYK